MSFTTEISPHIQNLSSQKNTKVIFFVGGGIECAEGIAVAKQQGMQVIVSDANPESPGALLADRFVQVSVYDGPETLQAVQAIPDFPQVDGVITLGCDAPQTVSVLAKHFGVSGLSMGTADLTTHKVRMKERLQESGVRVPWFASISRYEELERMCHERPGLKVLKPVDSRGARGVLRLDEQVDLQWAYDHSLSHSPCGELIIEEWIEGSQISMESLIWDDRAIVCGVADRDYSRTRHLHPYVIEDGGETPANLPQSSIDSMADMVHVGARALGVRRGTVKADVVLSPDGPYVVEIAARLSGGYFCTHNIPLVYGIDFVGTAIGMALGDEPDWTTFNPRVQQYVANRFLFLNEGTIKSIDVDPSLLENPNVALFRLYVKAGDKVGQVTNHTKRGGTVIAVGQTKEQAIAVAEDIIQSVKVEMA